MASDLKYWIAFSHIQKIGPVRFSLLLNHFKDLSHAWRAGTKELAASGIPQALAEEITIRRSALDPDRLIEELVKNRVQVITISDGHYPKLLKEIYHPPPLLYFKGNMKEEEFALAVVGTRRISPYGKQVTEAMVRQLVRAGLTIVSGLALGVDALAHYACLKSAGRTIAILGCGLDDQSIYPSSNRYLAQRIAASGGCLISEYPLGTSALKEHFPHRNRLISGISLGTLIIEAAEVSGALITAKNALEQNREVFAVPGSIYAPTSVGCNQLIQQGAKLVRSVQDILDEFDLKDAKALLKARETLPLNDREKEIYHLLTDQAQHFNELAKRSGKNAAEVGTILSQLEIKGLAKNLGGSMYVKHV